MRIVFYRAEGHKNIWRFKIVGWTIFKDLRIGATPFSEKPIITPEEIDAFLVLTPLKGLGTELLRVVEENAVNPIYILAHIIHETGWGRSAIFFRKKQPVRVRCLR